MGDANLKTREPPRYASSYDTLDSSSYVTCGPQYGSASGRAHILVYISTHAQERAQACTGCVCTNKGAEIRAHTRGEPLYKTHIKDDMSRMFIEISTYPWLGHVQIAVLWGHLREDGKRAGARVHQHCEALPRLRDVRCRQKQARIRSKCRVWRLYSSDKPRHIRSGNELAG